MKLLNNLEYLLMIILSFLAPIADVIFATGFFIVTDFITGVWAAKKSGEAITSSKMKNSIPKLLLYTLALIVGHTAEVYVLPEIPFVRVVSGFIAMVEIKSVFENISKITGLDLWSQIKGFLNRKK